MSSREGASAREDAENEAIIAKLLAAKRFNACIIMKDVLERLIEKVKVILLARPMLVEVVAPVKVLGDLHGQYYDLLHILDVIGRPSCDNQILILGDYVDRGKFGLETISLLFAYKVKYPDHVHLLRGNHESSSVSRVYGFYDECKARYDVGMWRKFMEAFDCLPVSGLINASILCMHGGLSPMLQSLDNIRTLARPQDVPPSGLFSDLLWSDPDKKVDDGWVDNPRGVSYTFGKKQVFDSCDKMKLDLIMRAHQVVFLGYELFADSKLITVFSAPNFCGQFENKGAIAEIDGDLKIKLILIDHRNIPGALDEPKSASVTA